MNSFKKYIKDTYLDDLTLKLNMTKGRVVTLSEYELVEEGDKFVLNFVCEPKAHLDHFKLEVRFAGTTAIFSIDGAVENEILSVWSFNAEKSVSCDFTRNIKPDTILGIKHPYLSPFWTYPTFNKSFDELDIETQNLIIREGERHIHILPLCSGNFRCEFDSEGMHVTPGTAGVRQLKGDVLALTVAADPYTAVKANYKNARADGAISVPLKEERTLPEMFAGFGWCTWDSFRHDVTAEKIYRKLDEFKEKKIPVKWVMIDDGWSSRDGWYLCDFAVDPVKFPDGLGACIERMKSEYGVEYVGVWHAFNGYWMGVKENSPLHKAQAHNLFLGPCGYYIPALEEEKAFDFWNTWHTYLVENGVDFLKVDNQSCTGHLMMGVMPTPEAARIAHRAMERSIVKNFDGRVINCMGMDMENVFARTSTALSRNSDDFYPAKKRGFVDHLLMNAYNAIWHGEMYYCDYDMWWSRHESAVQSGVLRAISGSPIYVSDEIGGSDPDYIMPTIGDDGYVMLCDGAAGPTLDCVYTDCRTSGTLMKIWNRSGDSFAVALFNVDDGIVADTFTLANVPGIDKGAEYVAYEYFSKKFYRLSAKDGVDISLAPDDTAVFSIYPVQSDADGEYVMTGNCDKYVPIADKNKTRRNLAEIF
ncbi:MAG: alpha-galactosidase [Clostridia bacterium]|nr:alpha-galactosidase [Clostridia bacterium]